MLASDILTPARDILDDTDSGNYRWSNAKLLAYCGQAIQVVRRLRPESQLTAAGQPRTMTTPTATTDTLVLDAEWQVALMEYVLSRAYAGEAKDEQDLARAKAHMDNFTAFVGA